MSGEPESPAEVDPAEVEPADGEPAPEPAAPRAPLPHEPASGTAPPRVSASAASVLAWALLALVNAGFILRLPFGPPLQRLQHHAYDAGQLLFAGAILGSIALVWTRFGPKRPALRLVAIALLAAVPAYLFLPQDLYGLSEDLAGDERAHGVARLLSFAVAPTVAAAAWVGGWLARPRLRWAGVVVGLAFAAANNVALPADYRGIHLFVALDAATLIAACLAGAALPRPVARVASWRFAVAIVPALAVLTAPSVLVRPKNAVRQELAKLDGAVFVSALARTLWRAGTRVANVPPELVEWFEDRKTLPPIPPTVPSPAPKNPIVILIGVDSMKADLFTNERTLARLPRLAAIRERSLDFTMARSPGSRTIVTWGSVFTGSYYTGIRWSGDGNRPSIAGDTTLRFPELLGKAGIDTSTFVSYGALDGKNVGRNFGEVVNVPIRKGQQFGLSSDAMPKIIERVSKQDASPLFLFAHLMDPHYPFDAAVKTGANFDRFTAEVALADTSIGMLWDTLESKGLLDRTVLIVTADHGEGFGQHGAPHHTVNLYEELIRVPLFIYAPGVTPRKIATPVTLMDLGPTILDLFRRPTPAYFLGQSLVPFMRGEDPVLTRPIAAERYGTHVLFMGSRKIILDTDHGREEIYDLSTDPNETKNLADDLGEEGDRATALARAFFAAHALDKE